MAHKSTKSTKSPEKIMRDTVKKYMINAHPLGNWIGLLRFIDASAAAINVDKLKKCSDEYTAEQFIILALFINECGQKSLVFEQYIYYNIRKMTGEQVNINKLYALNQFMPFIKFDQKRKPGKIIPDVLEFDAALMVYRVDTDKQYSLQQFMDLVKSKAPSIHHTMYKIRDDTLEHLFNNPTDKEYKLVVEMYAFRFYFGHSFLTSECLVRLVNFVGNFQVLEVGAGNGYIGHAMKLAGSNVVLTDAPGNQYPNLQLLNKKSWDNILELDSIAALERYPDAQCLMMIWPPPGCSMAFDTLSKFYGHKFIYIGERAGGQNGTIDFFRHLEQKWFCNEIIDIPNFIATTDKVYLYTRKAEMSDRKGSF